MAERTMVKEQLTPEMIQLGKLLIERLDKTSLMVQSALWFYIEESEKWRFIIASPQVKKQGPKKVYQQIQKEITSVKSDNKISLKDISVIEEDHSLIKLMSLAVGTTENISEIRFSRNTVNGHFIEDALIYRLIS